jgi:hypothetical protein
VGILVHAKGYYIIAKIVELTPARSHEAVKSWALTPEAAAEIIVQASLLR